MDLRTAIGSLLLLGTGLFAARLVYEQTLMTWDHGLQMVGFSLFHSGLGLLGVIFVLLSGVWLLVTLVMLALRKIAFRTSDAALTCAMALAVGLLFVPYGEWMLLMVRLHGVRDVPKDWLTYAAATGEVRLLKYLLSNGFDVNSRDSRGQSALGAAAVEGRTDIGRMLIARGARVDNRTDALAETPLTQAAQMNRTDMVSLLLEHGADMSEKDGTGRTALDWAHANGNAQMAAALEARLNRSAITPPNPATRPSLP